MLFNKVEKCLCIWFVCLSVHPSVHALTLVNFLHMFWNLYVLFISDVEWSALKILCLELKGGPQRHTKNFRYITSYGGREKLFKRIITYFCCTKYNLKNLKIMHAIQMYKSILPMKNGLYSINILYTGSHKSFLIHYCLCGKEIFNGHCNNITSH